jgi:hypothetical protein
MQLLQIRELDMGRIASVAGLLRGENNDLPPMFQKMEVLSQYLNCLRQGHMFGHVGQQKRIKSLWFIEACELELFRCKCGQTASSSNLHARVCEGGGTAGYEEPKRARCLKRPMQASLYLWTDSVLPYLENGPRITRKLPLAQCPVKNYLPGDRQHRVVVTKELPLSVRPV